MTYAGLDFMIEPCNGHLQHTQSLYDNILKDKTKALIQLLWGRSTFRDMHLCGGGLYSKTVSV